MGSFCFRACIKTGTDRLTCPQSSSGTEGEENCSGILAFQDKYDSSLFCPHYLLQHLTVRFFPDTWTLMQRTDADFDPTQPLRIGLEIKSQDNLG